MEELSTIGLDIAKQVFHAHGVDASGATVFSGRITRAKLIGFLREKGTLFLRRAGDEFGRPARSPFTPIKSGSESCAQLQLMARNLKRCLQATA